MNESDLETMCCACGETGLPWMERRKVRKGRTSLLIGGNRYPVVSQLQLLYNNLIGQFAV